MGNGLYDFRARVWSTELGVFLQADQYGYLSRGGTLWSWPGNNPFRWRDPSGRSAAELLSEGIELLEGLAPGVAANDVAATAGEGAGLAGYLAVQSLELYWGQVQGLGMDLFAEQDASANAIARAAARARPAAGGNGKEPPDCPTGKTHRHHSDPKFMGGDPKQPLTDMADEEHIQLHNDLNEFLEVSRMPTVTRCGLRAPTPVREYAPTLRERNGWMRFATSTAAPVRDTRLRRRTSFSKILVYSEAETMFLLAIQDNDLCFFRGQLGRTRCDVCGQLTAKRREDLATVAIKRRPKVALSTSLDGVCVVLPSAKLVLEAKFTDQLQFESLQAGLFAVMPVMAVEFDAASRKTRFGHRCPKCSEYDSVTGATPVFLKAQVPPGSVVRTDLEFGSDDEKAPLILAGNDAAAALSDLGLSGCKLVPQ
jgi:hypothetical protein